MWFSSVSRDKYSLLMIHSNVPQPPRSTHLLLIISFLSFSNVYNVLALLLLHPQSSSSAGILNSLHAGIVVYHTGNKGLLVKEATDTVDEPV